MLLPYQKIISCNELNDKLGKEDWALVDCRFDLAAPKWGFEEYQQLHIPGAVFADLDKDLSSKKTPTTGRHPLPKPVVFLDAMSRLGIGEDTQVIVYDATSGSYAARLWFLLRFYGHFNVALLDGGFSEWHKLGYAIESGTNQNKKRKFKGTPDERMIMTTPEIEKIINQPDWLLIDARSVERFRGEQETIDPIAGHIPGAVNRFHGENINSSGLLLPGEQLCDEFSQLIRGYKAEQTVVYCGSGVTSCHHLLAMAVAGLPQPKLYPGSWSEWIRNPAHPIAK